MKKILILAISSLFLVSCNYNYSEDTADLIELGRARQRAEDYSDFKKIILYGDTSKLMTYEFYREYKTRTGRFSDTNIYENVDLMVNIFIANRGNMAIDSSHIGKERFKKTVEKFN